MVILQGDEKVTATWRFGACLEFQNVRKLSCRTCASVLPDIQEHRSILCFHAFSLVLLMRVLSRLTLTGKNRITRGRTCNSVTASTPKLTRTNLVTNPKLYVEKLVLLQEAGNVHSDFSEVGKKSCTSWKTHGIGVQSFWDRARYAHSQLTRSARSTDTSGYIHVFITSVTLRSWGPGVSADSLIKNIWSRNNATAATYLLVKILYVSKWIRLFSSVARSHTLNTVEWLWAWLELSASVLIVWLHYVLLLADTMLQ